MSDSDRPKWVVPIVAALIAAIGTVIAALAPALFGSDEEAASSMPDATPSVSDGTSGTDRPTTRGAADTTGTAVIAYTGHDYILKSDPAVDLDSSTDGTGGDNIADVVHTDFALTAGDSARFTLLDRAQIPTLDICRSALEERGVDSIVSAQIETGVSMCIKTTAGRIGALTVTYGTKGRDQIHGVNFEYVIWKASR